MEHLETSTTDAIADLVQAWRIKDTLLLSSHFAQLSDGYQSEGPSSLNVTPKSSCLMTANTDEILNRLSIIEHAVSQMRSTVCAVCRIPFTKSDLDYKVMPCLCRYHRPCFDKWKLESSDTERNCVSCSTVVYLSSSALTPNKETGKRVLTKSQRSLTDGDLSVFMTGASHI